MVVVCMGIGKAMVAMICFMIAVVAMITMFAIAQKDKATDAIYSNATNTINATSGLAQSITTTGTGFMQAMILVVSILFFGAVIMIFRKK
jgi:hypothetical protein